MRSHHYLWLALAILMCWPVGEALAFKITEPAARTKLTSGQTVIAHVDLGNDIGIVKVRYYWYGEQDDTLVEQDDATAMGSIIAPVALVGLSHHDPAFGGRLLVPKEAIGPMRLLAVAEISRGRLGTRSVFDEILVQVEPKAALTTIDFETDKPLQTRALRTVFGLRARRFDGQDLRVTGRRGLCRRHDPPNQRPFDRDEL